MEAASLGQDEGTGTGAAATTAKAAAAIEIRATQTTEPDQVNNRNSNPAAGSGLANLLSLAEDLPAPEVSNSNAAGVSAAPAGLANLAGTADDLHAPYCVRYDKNGFPATLLDWRREPQEDHHTAR